MKKIKHRSSSSSDSYGAVRSMVAQSLVDPEAGYEDVVDTSGDEESAAMDMSSGDGQGEIARCMTPNPAVCTPGTTCMEAAIMMRDNDCGALPVVEGLDHMKPVGVITDRDLVVRGLAEGWNLQDALVVDLMTSQVFCIGESDSLEQAMELMEDHKIRRLVVVDESGFCCGMLAQADLARAEQIDSDHMVEAISAPGEEERPTL
jgi:CBS domain-containing protein